MSCTIFKGPHQLFFWFSYMFYPLNHKLLINTVMLHFSISYVFLNMEEESMSETFKTCKIVFTGSIIVERLMHFN